MRVWLDYQDRKRYPFHDAARILQDIADASEVRIAPVEDGYAVSTRLYPAPSKRWQRVSLSPFTNADGTRRKVAAVCWHGHYRFMSEVFARFPNARIRTGHAVYNGAADFDAKAEGTGDVNRGSMYAPMAFRDACTCTYPGDADEDVYDVLTRVRARLEELRSELRGERISYAELAELASLAPYIPSGDVELLEAAGVEEA